MASGAVAVVGEALGAGVVGGSAAPLGAVSRHRVLLQADTLSTDRDDSAKSRRPEVPEYEDATVALDLDGVTIESYRWKGDVKRVPYEKIRDVEVFEMGFWSGKFRVVGISFGRPRNWFPWGRSEHNLSTAISLDVGGWLRPTLVPDDPAAVERMLRDQGRPAG
jgi:hypothetical protein